LLEAADIAPTPGDVETYWCIPAEIKFN